MRILKPITVISTFLFAVLLVTVFTLTPTRQAAFAQDAAPVSCDSTLVTLLLVAEHDYDYLSSKVDTDEGVPNVDFGQFGPLVESIMTMMMETMGEMTEEEMMAMQEMESMLAPMMEMTSSEIIASYEMAMGMEMMGDITQLAPGDIAGENQLCTALRADVERFLIAHIVAEQEMMMMEDDM
jgi:hypothetical protein